MRSVKSGKKFETNYINNGCSAKIQINNQHSNGYNDFCEDSYLNSKYYMKKEYEDGTIVDTTIDKHKKGIGHGKLVSVEIIGVR
jgi:hypothetical protein